MSRRTASGDAAELGRFEADLDRRGADVESWPREARERARTLLGRSAAARALLSEQVALDRALEALEDHPVPAGLADRILSGLAADGDPARREGQRGPWERCWAWLTAALWRPAAAACAPFLLGYVLGATLPTASDRQTAEQFSALASTEIYEELADADP